jgi:DNA-directed RNA polymerase specialized sigma24 family protein
LSTGEGSVTRWIGDLRSSGDAAAQHLWERYFNRLVHLARKRLGARLGGGAAEDAEDAALSAFDSFCRGAAQGRYPQLTDRDDLWRLLVVITIRKAFDQIERQGAMKRGGGRLVDEAGLAGSSGREPDSGAGLESFAGREPSPEMAALVVEEYERLWFRLGDDSLRRILDLRLQGYTQEEIAAQLDRTVKTVTRKLGVIRRVWMDAEDRS